MRFFEDVIVADPAAKIAFGGYDDDTYIQETADDTADWIVGGLQTMRLEPGIATVGLIGGDADRFNVDYGHINMTQLGSIGSAPTAALAGLGAGNVDDGTHYYYIKFVTAYGTTGYDNSTESNIITVVDQGTDGQVSLTGIPTGAANLQVTARKIYRTAAGNRYTAYYLATIANNTTTTYTDNTADSGLDTGDPWYRSPNTTGGRINVNGNLLAYGDTYSTYFGKNTVIGTAGGNSCFGNAAGANLTSGPSNTLIGASAGNDLTTGSGNTFVGQAAGRDVPVATGGGVYIGSSAGQAAGGAGNVLIGQVAGYFAVGSSNVMIGRYSGRYHEGASNVFIGYNAGTALTGTHGTGNANVAIGQDAGLAFSTAANNTIIGYDAGDNLTSGSSNILIGSNVTASAADVNYEFRIGVSTTYILEGSMTSTIWVGTDYDFRTDVLQEFTAAAGIAVQTVAGVDIAKFEDDRLTIYTTGTISANDGITIHHIGDNTYGGQISLIHERSTTKDAVAGDNLGWIEGYFHDDAEAINVGTRIEFEITDVTQDAEETVMNFYTMTGGNMTKKMDLDDVGNLNIVSGAEYRINGTNILDGIGGGDVSSGTFTQATGQIAFWTATADEIIGSNDLLYDTTGHSLILTGVSPAAYIRAIDTTANSHSTLNANYMSTWITGVRRMHLDPGAADGASAEAYSLDTRNAFTTAGAVILNVATAGVWKMEVFYDGVVNVAAGGDYQIDGVSIVGGATGGGWTVAGNIISPETAGDDVRLAATEQLQFIDATKYIVGPAGYLDVYNVGQVFRFAQLTGTHVTYNDILAGGSGLDLGDVGGTPFNSIAADRYYVEVIGTYIDTSGTDMTFTSVAAGGTFTLSSLISGSGVTGFLKDTTDTFTGTLTVAAGSTPMIYQQTGASNTLEFVRLVVDSSTMRWDFSTSGGVSFTTYDTPISAVLDGAVALKYDATTRLATNSGGVTITGTATATTFSGALSGNATTATNLANISTSFSGTYPMTVNVTGTIYSNANVTYNGTSNTLTSPNFAGALTGNASSATQLYIYNYDAGDTNCPILFTRDSTQGTKAVYEDSAVYIDATNNRIYATAFYGAVSGTITSRTINGVAHNHSANITVEPYISSDDTGDTNCPIVFTQNSTAGYKRLYEDSAVYIDNTANKIYGADYIASSDRRLKHTINPATNVLERIMMAKGLLSTYIMRIDKTNTIELGYIAQDLLPIFPEIVFGSEEKMYNIGYMRIGAIAMEGVALVKTEVDELRERIVVLEDQVYKLTNRKYGNSNN